MRRATWENVLVALLLVATGSLGACAAQEQPQENVVLTDTTSSGHPAPVDDGRTVKQRLQDATIAAEVQKALLDTMDLRRFDFEVAATQGRVALRGSVNTDAERILAANIARDVKGVKDLDNQIALFPPDSVQATTDSTSKAPL
jgi:hyperosmotically inducible protein